MTALNCDGYAVGVPTKPPQRLPVSRAPAFVAPHPDALSGEAFATFVVGGDAWAPGIEEYDMLSVCIDHEEPGDHGMIVVVRTADGFEAGHWGYTVSEADDQVGLVVSLTRVAGWTESGLPAGIHDPEARAAWYAMRESTKPIEPTSSARRRGE